MPGSPRDKQEEKGEKCATPTGVDSRLPIESHHRNFQTKVAHEQRKRREDGREAHEAYPGEHAKPIARVRRNAQRRSRKLRH